MAFVNDPVVIYVARTLVAAPIMSLAKLIATIYLGTYALITDDSTKYFFIITFLMPIYSLAIGIKDNLNALFHLF